MDTSGGLATAGTTRMWANSAATAKGWDPVAKEALRAGEAIARWVGTARWSIRRI